MAKLFNKIDGKWVCVSGEGGSTGSYVDLTSNQSIAGNKTFTGIINTASATSSVSAVSDSTLDVSVSNVFTKTISAETTFAITGATSGFCVLFTLILTNGGSATVTWPTSVKWSGGTAPTLTAAGVDILTFTSIDGGATWYGAASMLDAK